MTTITGNVGREPDLRFTRDGTAVANFSLAHTPRRKNDNGEWEDAGETIWYRVAVWEQAAEEAAERITKGMRLSIDLAGAVKDRPYTNRDGEEKVSRNECTAQRITLPDGSIIGLPAAERTKAADVDTAADPWNVDADVQAPF